MLTDNVFLAVKPVDMRRGIDTLTQYIQDELGSTWHEGAAFVFVNNLWSPPEESPENTTGIGKL